MSHKKITDFLEYLSVQPRGFAYQSADTKQRTINMERQKKLDELRIKFRACNRCPLGSMGRKQVVFGQGNPYARLMFVGEGPGRDEDNQGKPFVGRAGQLLTKIIEAMGLSREDLFISNIVKCRPPENRAPLPNESTVCQQLILKAEIDIIAPELICTLGSTATRSLLGDEFKITDARGNFYQKDSLCIFPTYHPAYLLRNPNAKIQVWRDMQQVCKRLGITPKQ